MSADYLDSTQSEGKVRVAARRLAGKYPFHAAVVEKFKLVSRPEVGTMGVTVADDAVLLLHCPEFVLATPADQLVGVLLHEVHHVVFGHLWADPEAFADEWARTVAEEVTVNEFVREPLPAGVITLARFPGLPPLESTGERYQRLKRATRRPLIGVPGSAGGRGSRATVANADPQQAPQLSPKGKRPGRAAARATGGQLQRPAGGAEDAQGDEGLQTVDDHRVWQQVQKDLQGAKAVVRDLVQQAALEVGPDRFPPELRAAVEAFGVGSAPGGWKQVIQNGEGGRVEWRRLLRRYVGQVFEVRPVYNRPPRRFPEMVGILPGQRRQPLRPRVLAVLDTSGSITAQLLELISAELARLARSFAVKVVECDAAVQRVYDYRPLDSVCGRGGTDLRPPLEPAFLRRHRPDLVVYFTDGIGPAPDRPPGPPVIWCLTPRGRPPAAWGRVVRMQEA
jgi:predicted metal-dependent peptidase